MKTVMVKASICYDVCIGGGLLQELGARARAVSHANRAAIITDDTVDALYAAKATKSLEKAGFETVKYVFPHGEASKNISTWAAILSFLASAHLTRSDLVVALGGGVPGDIAGFAAASYLRGISFIQVPTTFLAAIDSSVGGKTAVDLPEGKNLAGAFYQPHLVLCDTDTLSTLPPETFADGAAEAIKYGVLRPTKLFGIFENGDVKASINDIIEECVALKRDVVAEDEFDHGARQFLNLGHTVGHAIEKLSCFSITHGHAVAAGMAIAARMSESLGIMAENERKRLEQTLTRNHLPIVTAFGAKELAEAASSDKKRDGEKINLILPEKIGACRLYPAQVKALEGLIRRGL